MNSVKKYSVLVIDDQANWRELLVDLLKDGFDVKSAEDYEGALELIRNQAPPFHVVVTDMRLKDEEIGNEDGLKLIEDLNKRGDETKTIVVTGYPTIDTTKRALSSLDAYDYLEKRPSDGKPFDVEEFQLTVHRAAEEAEKDRPEGFTDISYNVLVLEPNHNRRLKLDDALRRNGYQATVWNNVENLENLTSEANKAYALILVNESLANDDLFGRLQHLFPEGKIIIITSHDIGNVMAVMREYPILTAIAMPNENLDDRDFRDVIHAALAQGGRKYVSAQINYPYNSGQSVVKGIVGQTYHVNLSVQDTPSENAVGVNLVPQGNKKGKVKLHLYVHAKGMKVGPEVERYWDIPLSIERPESCNFSITPEKFGRSNIVIEIDQENRWLGRIQMKLDVESQSLGENQ